MYPTYPNQKPVFAPASEPKKEGTARKVIFYMLAGFFVLMSFFVPAVGATYFAVLALTAVILAKG